jgi:tetratricopeptide (TPR) repeat protein
VLEGCTFAVANEGSNDSKNYDGVLFIMRHLAFLLLLSVTASRAQETAHIHSGHGSSQDPPSAANRFGTVRFETSCNPSVETDFNNAVALLHSFEYEESQKVFATIIQKDPTCGMAQWGESMSYFHGLWGEYNAGEGAAAARTGDDVGANQAEQELAAMRDERAELPGQTPQNSMEVLPLAVAGWRAEYAGRHNEAVRDLRQAADLEDRLGTGYVTIKPVREMLADLLLMNGDPQQALVEYAAVLTQKPHRFNSLFGAGSAAFAQGNIATANLYYTDLLAMAPGDERSELATARRRTDSSK